MNYGMGKEVSLHVEQTSSPKAQGWGSFGKFQKQKIHVAKQ